MCTDRVIGAEALVRWEHPEKGLLPPGIFIPVLEKNGYIAKVDLYIYEETCIFLKKCMDEGIPLHLFNRKFIKDIDTFYGEYQAGEDSTSKGPLTNFTFEDVEPSIVAERG